jgi:hypothetical protein
MTPEERQVFGVSEEEERRTRAWLRSRMGSILGANGRGGTGTFIELQDGRMALLTARHVVVRCILTGEMTVLRLANSRTQSVEPRAITIDSRKDAALLIFDATSLAGDVVPYAEWSAEPPLITKGMPAIISGVVGEWKEPDLVTRTIPVTKWLDFWTAVTEPQGQEGYVVCDVDETNDALPRSFGGMSGGPFITLDRRLLGVNTGEIRRKAGSKKGEFFVTRLADLDNLFHPYVSPVDAPTDYMHQRGLLAFTAVNRRDRRQRVPAMVNVEYFWSRSNPDGPYGRIGRIIAVKFGAPTGAERYIINTESVFRWYDGDGDEDRLRAFHEELIFFLQDTGFELVRD